MPTAAAGLVVAILAGCQARPLQPLEVFGPQPAPKSYFTSTPDGWSLNLLRYQPSRPRRDADPVICCHGLGYNASFWDLTDQTSLPRFLQQRGYDVWCVSLRGSGQSTKPTVAQLRRLFRLNLTALQPEALLRRRPGLLKLNWTVDDHIRQDLPTILRFVTRTTGHRRLHWVGHSMGGMIIFAHLATTNDQRINTVVAVAVPMVMLRPLNRVFQTMLNNMQVVQIGNAVVSTSLPAIIGTLVGPRLQSPVDRLFYNADNVDYLVGHRLSYLAQEEISPGQFRQLMAMLRTGQFRSADGTVNYAEQLPSVRVPTLFVAGSLDQMATVGAVKWAYNRIGASDKRFVMFAKINGHLADYGHDDLIIGRHARSEVYPQILRWLEVHPRRSPAAQPTSAQQDRPRSNVNQPI